MSKGTLVGRDIGASPAVVDTTGMEDAMKRTLTERNYEAPSRNRPNVLAKVRERAAHMKTPFSDLIEPDTSEIDKEIAKKKAINAGYRYMKKMGY